MTNTPPTSANPAPLYSYACCYKRKWLEIQAPTTYDAQRRAAEAFKTRKPWEVTVMRSDITHSTASI